MNKYIALLIGCCFTLALVVIVPRITRLRHQANQSNDDFFLQPHPILF